MAKKLIDYFPAVASYIASASATSILWFSGFLQTIDLQVFDLLLNRFPGIIEGESPSVVIGITEKDISQYGWPLDDKYILKLLKNLDKAEVSVIGLDLYRNVGVGEGAKSLASYIHRHPKIISIFNVAENIPALPGLTKDRQAFNDIPLDVDNVIRRNLAGIDNERYSLGPEYISLPMRMLELHQKHNKKNFDLPQLFKAGVINTLKSNSGGYRLLDSNGYQILIDYSAANTIPNYSLGMVLNNEISPTKLKNKMIVVGATAPSLKDEFAIPFSRFTQKSNEMLVSGAEIHAQRANQLLSLQIGKPPGIRTIEPFWEFGLAIIFAIGTFYLIESKENTFTSVLTILITFSVFLLVTIYAFSMGWWVETALPILTIFLTASIGWIRKAASQQKQRQLMQRLLGQSTSPAVAEELWSQKDSLLNNGRFAGKELPVTILFSDTVGFSTVSENMSPAELLNWLNLGMEKFVTTITKNGGMVNKFTGDGFLAVFGVPLYQSPSISAKAAITTALELQLNIRDLKKELNDLGLPPLRLRIGIHSGKIIAGSLGGAERIEYAVIGDSVNVAARLESLEKHRIINDCRILASDETLDLVDVSTLQINPWGKHKVKGRDTPVFVSEIN